MDIGRWTGTRECERTLVRELLHVQHRNLDPPLRKQQHDALPNAVGAARHHHNLLVPVPRCPLPVVHHLVVQPPADGAQHAQHRERLELLVRRAMLERELRALRRVFRREEERDRDGGVEQRGAHEPHRGVERPDWRRGSRVSEQSISCHVMEWHGYGVCCVLCVVDVDLRSSAEVQVVGTSRHVTSRTFTRQRPFAPDRHVLLYLYLYLVFSSKVYEEREREKTSVTLEKVSAYPQSRGRGSSYNMDTEWRAWHGPIIAGLSRVEPPPPLHSRKRETRGSPVKPRNGAVDGTT